MSGRVSIDGDRRTLARLAAFTDRPRMRSYMARLSEMFGSEVPCPPPAPGLRTGSPVVAVLGSPNDPGGSISRIDHGPVPSRRRAVPRQPGAHLVLTGGFGAQFNTSSQPHWQHCARWITQRWAGAGHRIVGEVESRRTSEDIFLVREVVRSIGSPPVTVVTSDYHAARVRLLLDLLLPEAAVHATTHPTIDHDERRQLDRHESRALPLTVARPCSSALTRVPACLLTSTGAGWSCARSDLSEEQMGSRTPQWVRPSDWLDFWNGAQHLYVNDQPPGGPLPGHLGPDPGAGPGSRGAPARLRSRRGDVRRPDRRSRRAADPL
ncbi:ElyC/SanA/YdcF family protein [Salinispora arenicola]|uniref:ElyC/SanA/YdcF family protein n=1 Tax=Salinispora arenicola TaxID=168697 RepID=UPI0027DE5023|nr:ElyC/SanA/YdcF family protein [Salinispora arenicola]